jgi:hypothetical protein
MSDFKVQFAVYGALNSNEDGSQAADVKNSLQVAINSLRGIVKIDNDTMGIDPSVGRTKHFGAVVTRGDKTHYYACQEGQTIDFYHTLATTS